VPTDKFRERGAIARRDPPEQLSVRHRRLGGDRAKDGLEVPGDHGGLAAGVMRVVPVRPGVLHGVEFYVNAGIVAINF
jgi:hypothetical protein